MAQILELKITLRDVSKPPVWRLVEVRDDSTLKDLHRVIMATMGWGDFHLHTFDKNGITYSDVSVFDEAEDEAKVKVSKLLKNVKDKLDYVYDFGDSWEHTIEVKAVKPLKVGETYPNILKGKGACPPEDCGGAWGYEDLKETLKDPESEDHESMLEWLGLESAQEWKPDFFDLKAAKERLQQ